MTRLSWDEYFIEVAAAAALRTTCLRRKVGAVLVKDNRIIATGYNGPPAGFDHCETCHRKDSDSGSDLQGCYGVHAEQNAILYATKIAGDISGSTLYVTTQPCTYCCKIIIVAGISKVVFSTKYNDTFGLNMLKKAGIVIKEVNGGKSSIDKDRG